MSSSKLFVILQGAELLKYREHMHAYRYTQTLKHTHSYMHRHTHTYSCRQTNRVRTRCVPVSPKGPPKQDEEKLITARHVPHTTAGKHTEYFTLLCTALCRPLLAD